VTTYPLTLTQQAHTLIREEIDQAVNDDYRAGLRRALLVLERVDPDADPGPVEDGVSYGGVR
jgi:hypothetical protein